MYCSLAVQTQLCFSPFYPSGYNRNSLTVQDTSDWDQYKIIWPFLAVFYFGDVHAPRDLWSRNVTEIKDSAGVIFSAKIHFSRVFINSYVLGALLHGIWIVGLGLANTILWKQAFIFNLQTKLKTKICLKLFWDTATHSTEHSSVQLWESEDSLTNQQLWHQKPSKSLAWTNSGVGTF